MSETIHFLALGQFEASITLILALFSFFWSSKNGLVGNCFVSMPSHNDFKNSLISSIIF